MIDKIKKKLEGVWFHVLWVSALDLVIDEIIPLNTSQLVFGFLLGMSIYRIFRRT
jgi:hypothetical protein